LTFPLDSAFIGVMFNDQHPTAPALLTTQQAADRLGLTTTSLHDLRCADEKGFGYLCPACGDCAFQIVKYAAP